MALTQIQQDGLSSNAFIAITANILAPAGGTPAFTISSTTQQVSFSNTISVTNTFGFKNRIINGDMRIDQRWAGGANTITASGRYSVDRWMGITNPVSKFSLQQNAGSITGPTGFKYYLGATSLSAYSVGAGDFAGVVQCIEGYNTTDFDYGTSTAKTVTLSFWVYSSLTGTFGGSFWNPSGNTRSYLFTYTISSANTWEYKTITVTGDTSVALALTINASIQVRFGLGTGSTYSNATTNTWITGNYVQPTSTVSVIGTSGATFYFTGVQLETGLQATPFDYRDFNSEFSRCQRYFQKTYPIEMAVGTASRSGYINWNWGTLAAYATVVVYLPVRMRDGPTVLNYNPDLTSTIGGRYWNGSSEAAFTGSLGGWTVYQNLLIFNMDATSRSNMLFQYTADAEIT